MSDYHKLIGELKDLASWLYGKDHVDLGETASWASSVIEDVARERARPEPAACLCKSRPVVLEHLEADDWSVGCPQAFFRAVTGAEECRKPVIMRAVGRDNAIAMWNDVIRRCESEAVGRS